MSCDAILQMLGTCVLCSAGPLQLQHAEYMPVVIGRKHMLQRRYGVAITRNVIILTTLTFKRPKRDVLADQQ